MDFFSPANAASRSFTCADSARMPPLSTSSWHWFRSLRSSAHGAALPAIACVATSAAKATTKNRRILSPARCERVCSHFDGPATARYFCGYRFLSDSLWQHAAPLLLGMPLVPGEMGLLQHIGPDRRDLVLAQDVLERSHAVVRENA